MGDRLRRHFRRFEGDDGRMTADELRQCLAAIYDDDLYDITLGKPFNLETCRVMIASVDRKFSAKINFKQFEHLIEELNDWIDTFYEVDRDRSNTISLREMRRALPKFGYDLDDDVIRAMVLRHSGPDGESMEFDDFITCCLRLEAMTDFFRDHDRGDCVAEFPFQDYIKWIMSM